MRRTVEADLFQCTSRNEYGEQRIPKYTNKKWCVVYA